MRKIFKKIVTVVICFFFVFILPDISVIAEHPDFIYASMHQETDLKTHFIGSIRGGVLPTVGYSIDNIGDEIARDIEATFIIEGGFEDDIYLIDTLVKTELEPGISVIKSGIFSLFGFGPITVTLDVDAENAESIHRSAKGFQIGFRTFIFG
jgi:hypothetical protein